MPLSQQELAEVIERLDAVCREAAELRERLERAMVDRARRDLPDRTGQPKASGKAQSKTRQRRPAPDGEALVRSVAVRPKGRKRKTAKER